jgi:simple sugar transport system substrate-binding protein
MLKRSLIGGFAAALAIGTLGLAGCGKPAAPEQKAAAKVEEAPKGAPPPQQLKVGFVYVSPVGDAGWTSQHNAGREQMAAALGGKVVTNFVDKVPEGADAERVIRDLAQQGHSLIFTTSFGFMNPTIKVAEEFPNVVFEHATGYKSAKNVGTYNIRFYEGRYLAGIIAGKMTKSNTLGYVAAFPIPEVLQGINAFTLGARSVNPKAQVRVVWVNSWYDPGKERDAAMALLGAQGADVVTHHTDSTAVVAAAEERGKMAIGYHSNMSKFGPKAQLAAVTHHWGAYYTKVAQSVLNGKWTASNIWGGMKDGMIKLEAISDAVPAEVKAMVEKKGAEIAAGTFHPFTGPIKTNDGKDVIASGAMTDEQLGKMDFYVAGVVGKVPSGK